MTEPRDHAWRLIDGYVTCAACGKVSAVEHPKDADPTGCEKVAPDKWAHPLYALARRYVW